MDVGALAKRHYIEQSSDDDLEEYGWPPGTGRTMVQNLLNFV